MAHMAVSINWASFQEGFWAPLKGLRLIPGRFRAEYKNDIVWMFP